MFCNSETSETFSKVSSLGSMKNECKMGGHGPRFKPAMPIFQKHCFFKNGPKTLTKVENADTFSSSLEIEENVRAVKFHSNRSCIQIECIQFGF